VARQAEVVVRAEHDDPLAVDDGFRALVELERLEEGVEAKSFGLLDQREVIRFGEDIPVGLVFVSVEGYCVYRY
jgi:hypothetical protein